MAERAGGRQLGGEGNKSEARLFLALREKRLQPASSPRITRLRGQRPRERGSAGLVRVLCPSLVQGEGAPPMTALPRQHTCVWPGLGAPKVTSECCLQIRWDGCWASRNEQGCAGRGRAALGSLPTVTAESGLGDTSCGPRDVCKASCTSCLGAGAGGTAGWTSYLAASACCTETETLLLCSLCEWQSGVPIR